MNIDTCSDLSIKLYARHVGTSVGTVKYLYATGKIPLATVLRSHTQTLSSQETDIGHEQPMSAPMLLLVPLKKSPTVDSSVSNKKAAEAKSRSSGETNKRSTMIPSTGTSVGCVLEKDDYKGKGGNLEPEEVIELRVKVECHPL